MSAELLPLCLFDFNPSFDLANTAKFKYVLLKADSNRLLVRGWTQAEFHSDVVDETCRQAGGNMPRFSVVGGGRIQISDHNICVFGHSLGFPWDSKDARRNEVSAEIIKEHFASHIPIVTVTWNNAGY